MEKSAKLSGVSLTGEEFANAAGGRRGEGSMADRIRRYTFAAIVLPVLFLAMAGLARANTIIVNTLDSGTQPFPLCTLEDAVLAANTQADRTAGVRREPETSIR